MTDLNLEKQNAAKASMQFVEDGMIVGLGSGSTAEFMIQFLGQRVAEGLRIQGVPSSVKSENIASSLNIPLTSLSSVQQLDLYIDGADEVDPDFNMIKGGGGALLREKILAHFSKKNIFIVDSSKMVGKLGNFMLPIEIIRSANNSILKNLMDKGLSPILRVRGDNPFRTDEENFIIDVDISRSKNLFVLDDTLKSIPGIVETGLFLDYVDILIVGNTENAKIFSKER